ncbi:ATP-binding protein [Vibrio tubiashii]|uniref:Sensory/regulatory protein RpfC n=1 Tax=Vibrio tubiashii ATCC 19109 TaxID=1051646 RepID=F9TDV1_9VIBR|nr:ATP-binding protein [Vibrio tubiashii]AIW14143.1 histidine kinase [Vibrio tubiashii ATCC 19109]EGU46494.1 signal transduction histidine kinase [Vibrio tubiashii ATCC 19109]EIF02905.1 signal transduction histidine kinase [Vibrio tubiashii NCIMB 1337 = ATCC 19106]
MTLRSKTILGIAVIEITVLVILVLSAMSFLSDSNEKQLLQRANSSAVMFTHAAKDAVLSTDIATLEDLVQEFMTLEDVAYVRVLRNGQEMACAGDKQLLQRSMLSDSSLNDVDDGIFDLRTPIESNGTVFGYVDIGFETNAIKTMLDEAQKAIISIATIEVVLVAIFSFILGTYLTRNLSRLTAAANTVGQHGPGFQLNEHSKDELGEVTKAFDEMSAKLERDYQVLTEAREGAEQANDSKSRFLASMSHEIRTPMNGVLGILNILEETKLTDEQKKLVNTATESGHFLLSVINDILDFTRMESNTLILEDKPFDFRHCVESVVDSFSPTASNQNLILHCYIEGTVPSKVSGDKNRVKQILLNLIGNAIKFTHEGSVTIKVRSEAVTQNKAKIVCQIQDTGIGISKSAIEYLFDEFTMVDQTYSRSKEGSGLGLAICRRLCNLMDGEVSVESEPGIGSTFTFDITLAIADDLITSPTTTPKRQELLRPDARILVAEDNKANQLVIREMFKRVGLSIDIAENGKHAVSMVQEYQYDLIFMDISMPEMDGMEACQAIRHLEDDHTANLPIIALTAHSLAGDKEKFLASGMDDYLSKPLRLSQLIEKINLFLNNDSVEDEAQRIEPSRLNEQHNTYKKTQQNLSNQRKETAGLELVDEQILQQMIEDTSAEVIPLLIDHYVEESEQRLAKIYKAMDDKDKETLEFEAHTLGSSSLALGNRTLSNLARKIEHMCLDGQKEQAFSFKQELEHLAQQSLQALEERKQQGFSEPTQL